MVGNNTSMVEAFRKADAVLLNAVQGISDLMTVPGLINVDFADVRTIMCKMGRALKGSGTGSGKRRAIEAAEIAISSPLLEDVTIEGATGILINITGGPDLTLHEVNEAASLIQNAAHEDANIIFGSVIDPNVTDEVRITVIATGVDKHRRPGVSNEPRTVTTHARGSSSQQVTLPYDVTTQITREYPPPTVTPRRAQPAMVVEDAEVDVSDLGELTAVERALAELGVDGELVPEPHELSARLAAARARRPPTAPRWSTRSASAAAAAEPQVGPVRRARGRASSRPDLHPPPRRDAELIAPERAHDQDGAARPSSFERRPPGDRARPEDRLSSRRDLPRRARPLLLLTPRWRSARSRRPRTWCCGCARSGRASTAGCAPRGASR
jgi:hypothetical protein